MRVMVLLKAGAETGLVPSPTADDHVEMDRFNQALIEAGVFESAEGLQPSSTGVVIDLTGTSPTVTDGPFTETKELLVGFWIWKVESMDEAVEWATKIPQGHGARVEVRPIYGDSDLPEEFVEAQQRVANA